MTGPIRNFVPLPSDPAIPLTPEQLAAFIQPEMLAAGFMRLYALMTEPECEPEEEEVSA